MNLTLRHDNSDILSHYGGGGGYSMIQIYFQVVPKKISLGEETATGI